MRIAEAHGNRTRPDALPQQEKGTARNGAEHAHLPDVASKCPTAREPGRFETNEADDSLELGGVVETALAGALTAAAQDGQWELVGRLAAELEARRTARTVGSGAGAVADLGEARSKRKGETG